MADDASQHVFCTNCNLDLTTSRNGPWNVINVYDQLCYQCFIENNNTFVKVSPN